MELQTQEQRLNQGTFSCQPRANGPLGLRFALAPLRPFGPLALGWHEETERSEGDECQPYKGVPRGEPPTRRRSPPHFT